MKGEETSCTRTTKEYRTNELTETLLGAFLPASLIFPTHVSGVVVPTLATERQAVLLPPLPLAAGVFGPFLVPTKRRTIETVDQPWTTLTGSQDTP